MRKIALLLGLLAFVLNPGFACSPNSDDPGFTYGEKEMLSTVQGPWRVTIDKGNGPVSFTLLVDQAASASARLEKQGRAFIRSAHACGTRTFVKGAAACIDMSEMPLAVTFTSGDTTYKDIAYAGTFRVTSLNFTQGDLQFNFGTDWINANLLRDGTSATNITTSMRINQVTPATIAIDRLAI